MFLIEGMAARKSSRLPPGPPRQNREDLPTLVVAPRINIERNRAYLALLDDGHRDLTELRRTYGQLEERQLNQDRMSILRSIPPPVLHFRFPTELSSPSQNFNSK